MGLVALGLVKSSHVRDWTLVSRTGRQILYHWATREALFRTFWRVIPLQSSHRVPSQPNFPFCPTPFPILPQGNWSQHRSTGSASLNSLFPWECRKDTDSATYHVSQAILPVLFTSNIKHVLSRANRLWAKRNQLHSRVSTPGGKYKVCKCVHKVHKV